MKKYVKSLKLNMIFSAMRGMLGIVFPLVTFSYVSKIFGVALMGSYNFAVSIISYTLLIARLGINSYSIREGVRYRDNKEAFSSFANDILISLCLINSSICFVFSSN